MYRTNHAQHDSCVPSRHEDRLASQIILPLKSPWLNRIEPKWVHAKRAIAEPDRLLSKAELIGRICSYFTCKYVEHLKQAIAKRSREPALDALHDEINTMI
jgi:hypothetical protein